MQCRSCVFILVLYVLLAASADAAEPVGITAIDARAGIVTARDAAGKRTIQFKVTDTALLKSLRVGQTIQADIGTQKVTINYGEPCCSIVSVQNGSQTGVTGNTMQNAGGGPLGTGGPPVRYGKDYKGCTTCEAACKACADRNQGCLCSEYNTGQWSCACTGAEPKLPGEKR
jgi:hypothetical protein